MGERWWVIPLTFFVMDEFPDDASMSILTLDELCALFHGIVTLPHSKLV